MTNKCEEQYLYIFEGKHKTSEEKLNQYDT